MASVSDSRCVVRVGRHAVRRLAILVMVTTLLGIAGFNTPASPPAAQAAAWCSCVDYVRNAYHLTAAVPGDGGAQNMAGTYLRSQGFRQTGGPTLWGIVVFSSRYPGMNSQYGHVGLVTRWSAGPSGWTLTIRSANQAANSGNWWGEQGCTNVSDWTLSNPVPYGSPYVTYWSR